jgi:hypothetical protein
MQPEDRPGARNTDDIGDIVHVVVEAEAMQNWSPRTGAVTAHAHHGGVMAKFSEMRNPVVAAPGAVAHAVHQN